jgi:hypothetical protein
VRKSRLREIGLVAAASMVLTGGTVLGVAEASASPAGALAAHEATTVQQLDALGGSGAAGMSRAEAAADEATAEAELTGDITFSVPGGTFQGQVSVELGTTVQGAQIRYTTDGSVPTASSTLYSGTAVTITKTAQLRAQAFVGGTASGAMGTAVYIARSVNATHDLPLLVLDAYGRGKPKREYIDAAVMVMDKSSGTATLAQKPAIATRGGFHLRGQSSANFEKAPYRLELWNNENKDADYPVLGMPSDSDWVLRGPYPDKTLIRDAFAYSLARDMGLAAPRFSLVEFYLNLDNSPLAANDYQGVYMLTETIKRSPDRVNIQKLKKTQLTEPEISGGYILQFNMMAAEPPTLTCTKKGQDPCWSDLEVSEPDNLQPAQQTWITNYIQKFHDSLHSANPSNPQTGYPAYIDVDSFVNRIIHNEVAREGDSYMRSTHFYKDRGGKLVAGPVWDYDLGYDAVKMQGWGGSPTSSIEGWQYQGFGGGGMMMGTSDWFIKLMADQAFLTKVKNRWASLRQGVLSDAQLQARVQTLTKPLANAATRNFQKWNILGQSTVGMFTTQTTSTWQEQVTIMQNFLLKRCAWLSTSNAWGGGSPTQPPTSPPPTSPPPTSPPPTGEGCNASYAMTGQWDGGLQGEIKVTAGKSAIKGWKVTWTFDGDQAISQSWSATVTSSGKNVTATNVAYNGSLSPGASTIFGFIATWRTGLGVSNLTCTAS